MRSGGVYTRTWYMASSLHGSGDGWDATGGRTPQAPSEGDRGRRHAFGGGFDRRPYSTDLQQRTDRGTARGGVQRTRTRSERALRAGVFGYPPLMTSLGPGATVDRYHLVA